jgi:hypothetical protein
MVAFTARHSRHRIHTPGSKCGWHFVSIPSVPLSGARSRDQGGFDVSVVGGKRRSDRQQKPTMQALPLREQLRDMGFTAFKSPVIWSLDSAEIAFPLVRGAKLGGTAAALSCRTINPRRWL